MPTLWHGGYSIVWHHHCTPLPRRTTTSKSTFDCISIMLRLLFLAVSVPASLSYVATSSSATSLNAATLVAPDTTGIIEQACLDAAARMKRLPVPVSTDIHPDGQVGVSYVHWPAVGGRKNKAVPIFLVHGFDSSCLEYRRLGPLLAAQGIDTYAVDLLGWGFSQLQGVQTFGAAAKVEALSSFIQQTTAGKPFCISGASLGGAAAIEVAAGNKNCQGLVLLDAQGFVDGIGPLASLPTPLAKLGVGVLKSKPLRSSANQMSYFNKELFATNDALAIGRVHCMQEGWDDALVSFMQSGGFSPSAKVPTIQVPTLILWGRQDKVLDPNEFVPKFMQALPDARLVWVEECGHVPHLEQPEQTTASISEFVASLSTQSTIAIGQEESSFRPEWIAPLVGLSALAAYAADLLPVH